MFTYSVPAELNGSVRPGMRVLAPFGKRNTTGIVVELASETDLKKVKPVVNLLDAEPVLTSEMLDFCKWMSEYYYCPIGEVVFAAIPRGNIVESKVIYSVNKEINLEKEKITSNQFDIIDALGKKPLTIKQLETSLGVSSLRSTVKALEERRILAGSIVTSKEKAKEKLESFVTFDMLEDFEGFTNENPQIFFEENKLRNTCQRKALTYLAGKAMKEISQRELVNQTGATPYSIRQLEKKGFVSISKKAVHREVEHEFSPDEKIKELNPEQKFVLEKITAALAENKFHTFLLHGVTGSGKTQVYIEAINDALKENKTAIVLVPEISLTPQLIHRFRTYFGDIIGVIHSKLSDGQRFDVYSRIRTGETRIVIGARSALFAPLKNIGIIMVDEEHDHSYKQTEKSPKYNARDSAIVRAKLNNAVIVLGSATPSLESYYNYKAGKYTLLELPHRAQKTRQPQIEIVDMLQELRSSSKFVKYETPEKRFLSSKLIAEIDHALKNRQSIILLQNRRGYSAYSECQDCGTVKMCPNCDITLIYHKLKNHLRCHYCGHIEHLPEHCEKCGNSNLLLKGTGTEKVEEEIQRLFPKAKVQRMDSDTVKGKDAHRKILKSFHEGEFDILIGTQMISKGLDFPNVHLVGVISADIGLMNPDFRSHERTFQLLMQVAGRSGRASDFGKVIIQTMQPENPIFQFIKEHNYTGFFEKEIKGRMNFRYPPFSRMTLIEVSSPDAGRANNIAAKLYLVLKNALASLSKDTVQPVEIMKPAPALIFKLKNRFRYHIILKSLKSHRDSVSATEHMLAAAGRQITAARLKTSDRVSFDIDPVSFY